MKRHREPELPFNAWITEQYRKHGTETVRTMRVIGPSEPLATFREMIAAIVMQHCSGIGCTNAVSDIRQLFECRDDEETHGRNVLDELELNVFEAFRKARDAA